MFLKSFGIKLGLFFVAAVLMISNIGISSASAGLPFKDIASSDDEIIYLYNKGLIKGMTKTTYSPEGSVTREQAATMIGRALNLNGKERKTSFPDVKASSYASGFIQSAFEKGIITGDSDGKYRPTETMTRGEMAFLLSRAFNYSKTGNVFFTDIKTDASKTSLYTAVNKIATAGISNGTGKGKYSPNADLNRRDFATFVARALNSDFRVSFKNAAIDEMVSSTNTLNVRKGPGTGYSVVGQIHKGDRVQVYGYSGTWAYGKSGSYTGYISMTYLNKVTEQSNVIVIDAGHGGNDPGAVDNGIKEKDVNLDVSKRVQKKLKAKGIKVLMIRTTDVFYSLDYRASYGAKHGADAFVSIHANASGLESVNGSETFYSAALSQRAKDSKQLATYIQNRLHKAMNHNNRGVKEYDYRVLAGNPLPAALVELGFVTGSADAAKLKSSTYKDKAATAIAEGIEDYYNWKAKQ